MPTVSYYTPGQQVGSPQKVQWFLLRRSGVKHLVRLGMIVAMALLTACATTKSTSKVASGGTKYSEDLSGLRPKVEASTTSGQTGDGKTSSTAEARKQTTYMEPKYAVNGKLDGVLDSIDRANLQRAVIDGFTIQVYSGAKKDDALKVKAQLSSSLPDLQSEVLYAQPNFRVKVGKYYSRMEAHKDYLDVKKLFPSAVVVPDRIAVR